MIGYVVVSVCIVEIYDKRCMFVFYQMMEIIRDEVEILKLGYFEEVINLCFQDYYIMFQCVVVILEFDVQFEKSNGVSWGWSYEEFMWFYELGVYFLFVFLVFIILLILREFEIVCI